MYYFASDVHLGAGDEQSSRRTEQCFVKWLDMAAADAEAIFLLGDIFDFWFEYSRVVPKGFVRTLGKLAELTDRGIKIYLFTGNHDMWCRDYLQRECGVDVIFSPMRIRLAGRNLYLAHGDNMNIGDKPVLRLMNGSFRSNFMRKAFSTIIHPDLAMRFGQWWSGKSRRRHLKIPLTRSAIDFLVDYARQYQHDNPDTDYIIFGHMHYPCDINEPGIRILFLGTWIDDPTYAVLDDEGNVELKHFKP